MTGSKRKARGKQSRKQTAAVRAGGVSLRIPNSGLEVWLYDDENRERIRQPGDEDAGFGGMPPRFEEQTRAGLIVGYSLYQDDDVRIDVHVGPPLTDAELNVGRWLEPQIALLHLPSGKLCIESNDASRLGPENPTETGATVDVPPGAYRLTLYRIDHEALDREGVNWQGAHEVVALTPGGTAADAAFALLPFEPRRDDKWIGQYAIRDGTADALVWFGDYWDTFLVNLDADGLQQLGITPGSYLRTHVPAAGVTLLTVYAESWHEAKRLPPPADIALDEYGYAALNHMSDWNGAQALFCRRERTKTRIEDAHHNIWVPATIEVIAAHPIEAPKAGQLLAPAELRTMLYYDPSFLGLILSDVMPEVADLDQLELPEALDRLDRKFAVQELKPQGDVTWLDRVGSTSTEFTCRLYTGPAEFFAVVLGAEGVLVLLYLSELEDGGWIVTGLADDIEHRIERPGPDGIPMPHERVQLTNMDESLAKIFAAHRKALRKAQTVPAPPNLDEAGRAWERFLTVGFGTQLS